MKNFLSRLLNKRNEIGIIKNINAISSLVEQASAYNRIQNLSTKARYFNKAVVKLK